MNLSIMRITDLVKLRERDDEKDGCDMVKAMNPLFPLRSLSSHVKHVKDELSKLKLNLDNASGDDSGAQDILITRHKVVVTNTVEVGQEVAGRVVELKLGSSLIAELYEKHHH